MVAGKTGAYPSKATFRRPTVGLCITICITLFFVVDAAADILLNALSLARNFKQGWKLTNRQGLAKMLW
jgi:hypothetical protein